MILLPLFPLSDSKAFLQKLAAPRALLGRSYGNIRGRKRDRSHGKNLLGPRTRLAHGVNARWPSKKKGVNGLDFAPRAQRQALDSLSQGLGARIENRLDHAGSSILDSSLPVGIATPRLTASRRQPSAKLPARLFVLYPDKLTCSVPAFPLRCRRRRAT